MYIVALKYMAVNRLIKILRGFSQKIHVHLLENNFCKMNVCSYIRKQEIKFGAILGDEIQLLAKRIV